MAYMNQETKREIKVVLDNVIAELGMKGKIKYTLGVRHHSVIVCTVKSCTVDFIKNYNEKVAADNEMYGVDDFRHRTPAENHVGVNPYHADGTFTGNALMIIEAMLKALNTGNYNNSEPQTDYFDVGFYVDLNLGRWDKAFEVLEVKSKTRKAKTKPASKVAKEKRDAQFQQLYNAAVEAGEAAGKSHSPTPMVVQQRANAFDVNSKVVFQETVNDGVCGFAWVQVKPGTSAFAKFLKKNDYARADSYYGGVSVWVGGYNQSMERKAAHASAMAKVFADAGINAYSMSRMD